jgi:cysteinyl-tRNA synthetase
MRPGGADALAGTSSARRWPRDCWAGFDIHGGGLDLLFPHHENEAAQTRCARGTELARFWVHNGMLELGSEKMAKSVGNIAPLHEVIDRYGRDAVVLFFCGAHYRQPIDFGPTSRSSRRAPASRACARWPASSLDGPSPVELAPLRERFFERLADDFNTPRCARRDVGVGARGEPSRDGAVGGADLREMLDVLGLANLLDATDARRAPPRSQSWLRRARRARDAGDFARADELRAQILAAGWIVRDDPGGFAGPGR